MATWIITTPFGSTVTVTVASDADLSLPGHVIDVVFDATCGPGQSLTVTKQES